MALSSRRGQALIELALVLFLLTLFLWFSFGVDARFETGADRTRFPARPAAGRTR